MTISKALNLAALILFLVATVLCFASTDISLLHIVGLVAAGLACLAAAPVVT